MTTLHDALVASDFLKAAELVLLAEMRRETFLQAVGSPLLRERIVLYSVTSGRAPGNVPMWSLCLTREGQLATVRVLLDANVDRYSPQAIQKVLDAVLASSTTSGPPSCPQEPAVMPPSRAKTNPSKLTREEIDALARAYAKGQDIAGTKVAQDMARAQADRVHRAFEKLQRKIRVEFTERDPYASFPELQADVLGNHRMYVYTLHSETPLWDERTNWMARAVHDYDHVIANTDFSVEGELHAAQFSAVQAPSLEPLYMSEIALQAASSAVLGGFPSGAQKLVAITPEVERIARTFRRNAPDKASAWSVWDAAGALRFMSPEELMQRLATTAPYDEAMLLVLAAQTLDAADPLG